MEAIPFTLKVSKESLLSGWRTQEEIWRWVSNILRQGSIVWVDMAYAGIIDDTFLVWLFQDTPILWVNLRQKLKSHLRKNNNQMPSEENEVRNLAYEILDIFLLPLCQREEWVYPWTLTSLNEIIIKEIVINRPLWELIEEHTPFSFIEQPTEVLNQLDKNTQDNKRCLQIENIIFKALARNLFWPDTNDKPNFIEIHTAVIYYLDSIFGFDISTSIPELKTTFENSSHKDMESMIIDIAKVLRKSMNQTTTKWSNSKWSNSKWWNSYDSHIATSMYLKGLFAWWYIYRIRKQREQAKVDQKYAFEELDNLFWEGLEIPQKKYEKNNSKDEGKFQEDNNIHERTRKYTIEHDGRVYVFTVNSRIKSIRSIFIKLFADDNYIDADALLDMLWIRVFFEGSNTPEVVRMEIATKIASLFTPNGYIFKNKGLFSDGSVKKMMSQLEAHPPLLEKNWKKTRSSWDYTDAKFSGYLIGWRVWTEIQFFDHENAPDPLWDAHHSILEASRIIQWWCRGVGYIKWSQVAYIIQRECFDEEWLSKSWLPLHMLNKVILGRVLVPYLLPRKWENPPSVIFAYRWYERLLEGHFKEEAKKLSENSALIEKINEFWAFHINRKTWHPYAKSEKARAEGSKNARNRRAKKNQESKDALVQITKMIVAKK
jgi:hypothetical protein